MLSYFLKRFNTNMLPQYFFTWLQMKKLIYIVLKWNCNNHFYFRLPISSCTINMCMDLLINDIEVALD